MEVELRSAITERYGLSNLYSKNGNHSREAARTHCSSSLFDVSNDTRQFATEDADSSHEGHTECVPDSPQRFTAERDPLSQLSPSPIVNDPPENHRSIDVGNCFCFGAFRHKGARFSCNRTHRLTAWLSDFECTLRSCCGRRFIRHRIPNENLLVLSIIQILCGFASIILSSVALTKAVFLYRMATGMWAGFFMLITGTHGLIATRRPIMCTLAGLLILCVITTTSAGLLIGVSVAGTIEDGFLSANSKSKSSFQVVKLTYAFNDQNHLKTAFHEPEISESPKASNVTHSHPFRLRTVGKDFPTSLQDSHLRTCQVILHVLLLLVGILESSVGLSTSVLCCRYICLRNNRSRFSGTPPTTRTNIVSFDTTTANQAAAILQSGNVGQFIGTGNLLLAVESDCLLEPEYQHPSPSYSAIKPHVHHTVRPFIPDSSRSALILTQAGTGAMAWTAARAAATLLDHNRQPCATRSSENSQVQPPLHRISRTRCKRTRISLTRNSRRPRLHFTSLRTPSSEPVCSANSFRDSTSITNNSDLSYPPGSTLLYVVPSPSRDEPPIIFPPFPPTYSTLQRRPAAMAATSLSTTIAVSRSESSVSQNHNQPESENGIRHLLSCNGTFPFYRIFRRRSAVPRRPIPRAHRRHNGSNSGLSASSLMCAVDRLLQPVLIIEDPQACISFTSTEPPGYSVIDPNPMADHG